MASTPNSKAVAARHKNSGSEMASDRTWPLTGRHWNISAAQNPAARWKSSLPR